MDVIIQLTPVSAEQAVLGMKPAFLRPFGRGPFARRLGAAAWTTFSAALVHGAGMPAALAMARTAAAQRNAETLLVARWSRRRLTATVRAAGAAAASAP